MKRLLIVLGFSLVLAGCGTALQPSASGSQPTPSGQSSQSSGGLPIADLSRTDEQGAVVVTVKPINLDSPGQALDFEISLNTHTVGLDMDLAGLATLTTDKGLTAKASSWDAPRGGHHVSGKLLFPASINGTPILKGAAVLTLSLRDVDAPERIFKWELSK